MEESETEAKALAALREALIAGEESGPAEPFDFEDLISRKTKDSSY